MREHRYDVALSFAGEQREFAAEIAGELKARGIRVFYDDYEKVTLWGKDLYEHLDWVYREASRYAVLFVSEEYAEKVWTSHERKSAQARAIEENREYVLPIRMDDAEIPGLRSTIGYLKADDHTPDEIADLIREKLGARLARPAFPPTTERLWTDLGIAPEDREEKKRVSGIAAAFHSRLGRMTWEERMAVCGVIAFGCPGELPDLMHTSLERLHRYTRRPKAELLDSLARVRPMGIDAGTRELTHHQEGDLFDEEDVDVTLDVISLPGDEGDGLVVVERAVRLSADHFCADHGLDMVTVPDFSLLAEGEAGPFAFDDRPDAG